MSSRASDLEATTAPAAAAVQTDDTAQRPPRRIVIQYAMPSVDGGRYPVKRCIGDRVDVSVDVFRDGHEKIRAAVRYRAPDEEDWREIDLTPLDHHLGGVRWTARFDKFSTASKHHVTPDSGRENGHALTIAVLHDMGTHVRTGLEYVKAKGDRPGVVEAGIDPRTSGSTITLELRYGF